MNPMRFLPTSAASFVRLVLVAGLFSPLALGCRGESSRDRGPGGGTGDGDGDGSGGAIVATVYEVQSPEMPVDTAVTLREVVVTAVDNFGDRRGGIYVMEPEGGPRSGVFVYLRESTGLQPGDVIDLENAVKTEFALSTKEDCDRASDCTLTELSGASAESPIAVIKVGEQRVPAPAIIDITALNDVEAEKWEGVLVALNNVRVFNKPRCVGSSCSDPTLTESRVTGPFFVQSSLAPLAADGTELAKDDCLTQVVGVMDYFFDYKVQMVSAERGDALTGGCLLPEVPVGEDLTVCSDGFDNDLNGFADCEDNTCRELATALCTTATTVVDVQNDLIEAGTLVRLEDVVVTARAFNGKSAWVQDPRLDAGARNGLLVFSNEVLPTEVAIGATVTLNGELVEFAGTSGDAENESVTELKNVQFESVTAGDPTTTRITAVPVGELAAEDWEGVLVTVENVRITSVDTHEFTVSDGTGEILVDDVIARFDGEKVVDRCLRQITGILDFNAFDQAFTLLMLNGGVDDTEGTCN